MDLTIIDDNVRFGVRTAAIILNSNKTKILLQKVKDIYMLPGGRMHTDEDSYDAIKRELVEELNLNKDVTFKFSAEVITNLPDGRLYHELGYYYSVIYDEISNNQFKTNDANDGEVYFKWFNLTELDNLKFIPKKLIPYLNVDTPTHLIIK